MCKQCKKGMEERSQIWIQRSKSSYKLFGDVDTFQKGKRCEEKKSYIWICELLFKIHIPIWKC